jgi:hypothetical protein
MAIKVKLKSTSEIEKQKPSPVSSSSTNPLKVPAIAGSPPRTPNVIISAVKIMLMDIRMILRPRQTAEELAAYSQFSNLVYGRK